MVKIFPRAASRGVKHVVVCEVCGDRREHDCREFAEQAAEAHLCEPRR
jgi:hypothetical protein